jgi:hypothetical protein
MILSFFARALSRKAQDKRRRQREEARSRYRALHEEMAARHGIVIKWSKA